MAPTFVTGGMLVKEETGRRGMARQMRECRRMREQANRLLAANRKREGLQMLQKSVSLCLQLGASTIKNS